MSNTLTVVNPYDLSPIGEVTLSQWDTIDNYLETAKSLHSSRDQWLSADKRITILKKTANSLEQQFDDLAYLIANEGGKPLIDAKIEVGRATESIRLCAEELSHLADKQTPMGHTPASAGRITFTLRDPIGPVVAVSAFNHPLNLIAHQVGPAVAAGCPVLVKPANDTPLSCQRFVEILYQAGLPEEWCRFTPCNVETAEKMVTDPRVAFFSFIGSAKVGWMLKSKLAPGVRCALEHGGVAPVIVDESVDIDVMLPLLLKGGFYHSGQVCVSVQRVFAPTLMANSIATKLAEKAAKLKVGNAVEETTECGPLIRPREVDRVAEWVDEAIAQGAQLLCGGKKLSDTTYAPTVLLNPSHEAKVSTQEIFGPVVCIYGYSNIDDALQQANALPYAFQASIFSNTLDTAMHCIQQLDASTVMVNDHTAFRVDWMPFGGRKHSGYGIGGIANTLHDMTQEKMAVIKLK